MGRLLTFTFVVLIMMELTSLVYASSSSVNIWNELGDGEFLGIHCRSANNDLGPQSIKAWTYYGFGCTMNIWGTTLFWCDFTWREHKKGTIVWRKNTINKVWNCNKCEYHAKPDGFYQNEHDGSLIYFGPWDS